MAPLAPWQAATASNGLNTIGFGAESALMGGADAAVARDSTAVNTNPAGLVQVRQHVMDLFLAPYAAIEVRHRDRLGNDQRVENPTGAVLGMGYAQRVGTSSIVAGIGLFAQGGAGYVYDGLETGYGNRDELSSLFGAFRLTTGLGWRVDERLSLGAHVGLNFAQNKQKIFPDTSSFDAANPQAAFFGSSLKGLSALAVNGKLGLQYRLDPALRLGLTYASESALDLKGGELTVNYEAIGLGKVRYRDARLSGLGFGQQVEGGLAWTPSTAWLLAAELTWIDWSKSMHEVRLLARRPDNPDAPAVISSVSAIDWRDQYVVSVGGAYQWDERTTLRAGYNYGRSPVRRETLNPLLALINEHHLSAGLSRRLGSTWELGLGTEYHPRRSLSYDNDSLPVSRGATEIGEVIFVHVMLSRRW